MIHDVRSSRQLLALYRRLPQHFTVHVLDTQDGPRSDPDPEVGERRVGLRHFDRLDRWRSDGGGGHPVHPRSDAHAVRVLGYGLKPDAQADLDRDHVDGCGQGIPDRDRAPEVVGEVARGPD